MLGWPARPCPKLKMAKCPPTYEALKKLAEGLAISVPQLPPLIKPSTGALECHKRLRGQAHATTTYEYELLAAQLFQPNKYCHIAPLVCACAIEEFDGWVCHDSEEFLYVLTGRVRLYSEFYAPLELQRGDSCYYDASMGHNVISQSQEDATILWVTSLK